MKQTTFHIAKMDCSAEEQMVRMRLSDVEGVRRLRFDLPARRLRVDHSGDKAEVSAALEELGLESSEIDYAEGIDASESHRTDAGADGRERKLLSWALAINAAFFVAEFSAGVLANSMGLVADSLDMLADALVYAISLAAVGTATARKKRLALYSGYLQFGLAVFGLVEVGRRFLFAEAAPDVLTMVFMASLALVGNAVTLWILSRARRGEAHVEASWIFTSNDIKVNALVIASAMVVLATGSAIPDLVAGAFIFVIVANGARRIMGLAG